MSETSIQEIIDKIKASVKPAMDAWVDDGEQFLGELKKYCRHGVYLEPEIEAMPSIGAYGAIARRVARVNQLKTDAGYTKACERYFVRKRGDIRRLLEKEAALKLAKIDIAVAKKLADVDVQSVELIRFATSGKDYFCEGAWKINNDHVLSFRTIYAGGWNIQCKHIRTIYSYN